MQCPTCDGLLVATDYEGVLVANCNSCGGHWLDAQELRTITELRERKYDQETVRAIMAATPKQEVVLADVDRKLRCPQCRGMLRASNYGGDTGIVIDRCADCGGIWLDDRELQNIEMLIEGWEQELDNDLQRYGHSLDLAEKRIHSENPEAPRSLTSFLSGAVLGIFRLE